MIFWNRWNYDAFVFQNWRCKITGTPIGILLSPLPGAVLKRKQTIFVGENRPWRSDVWTSCFDLAYHLRQKQMDRPFSALSHGLQAARKGQARKNILQRQMRGASLLNLLNRLNSQSIHAFLLQNIRLVSVKVTQPMAMKPASVIHLKNSQLPVKNVSVAGTWRCKLSSV